VTLRRLVNQGDLNAVEIENIPNRTFFIRTVDLPTLDRVRRGRPPKKRAAIIGALDNLSGRQSVSAGGISVL